MNKVASLRLIFPAVYDTAAFSCSTLYSRAKNKPRCLSTSACMFSADNKDININPLFTNRNPRALEFLGLSPKRKGWKYQSPRVDYYHKMVYDKDSASAYIEHCSGRKVLSASSKEVAVAKHLYNLTDVSANWNVGRLLGRRMLEAGITNVIYEDMDTDVTSEKKKAFLSALRECTIQFTEPDEGKPEHIPGINYDGYNRLNEEKTYQTDYQKL